jgi:hypothetical protein
MAWGRPFCVDSTIKGIEEWGNEDESRWQEREANWAAQVTSYVS